MLADHCTAGVSLYLLSLLRKMAICGIIKNINFQKMRNFNGT